MRMIGKQRNCAECEYVYAAHVRPQNAGGGNIFPLLTGAFVRARAARSSCSETCENACMRAYVRGMSLANDLHISGLPAELRARTRALCYVRMCARID